MGPALVRSRIPLKPTNKQKHAKPLFTNTIPKIDLFSDFLLRWIELLSQFVCSRIPLITSKHPYSKNQYINKGQKSQFCGACKPGHTWPLAFPPPLPPKRNRMKRKKMKRMKRTTSCSDSPEAHGGPKFCIQKVHFLRGENVNSLGSSWKQ